MNEQEPKEEQLSLLSEEILANLGKISLLEQLADTIYPKARN